MSGREEGIGWNLTHSADMQMLMDIASELNDLGERPTSGSEIALMIYNVVRRAQKGQW